MRVDQFSAAYPVFTRAQFRDECFPDVPMRDAEKYLDYHVSVGRFIRAARGVYAVVPPRVSPDDFLPDAVLVGSRLRPDAVVSHHSALDLHGLAYTVDMNGVTMTSSARPIELETRVGTMRFVATPKALSEDPAFGTVEQDRLGLPVRVTGLERTLAECIERPDLAGGFEEIHHALDSVQLVNVARLVGYVEKRGLRNLAGVVGWWLETKREEFHVGDEDLTRLLLLCPDRLQNAPGFKGESGHAVERWNVRLPPELAAPQFEGGDEQDQGFLM